MVVLRAGVFGWRVAMGGLFATCFAVLVSGREARRAKHRKAVNVLLAVDCRRTAVFVGGPFEAAHLSLASFSCRGLDCRGGLGIVVRKLDATDGAGSDAVDAASWRVAGADHSASRHDGDGTSVRHSFWHRNLGRGTADFLWALADLAALASAIAPPGTGNGRGRAGADVRFYHDHDRAARGSHSDRQAVGRVSQPARSATGPSAGRR